MLASCLTRDGRAAMSWPMLKNVAGTPYRARIDKMLAVLAPGPSSKVRATVLPLPGATLLGPYGAAGQLVDTCGEMACGGVATWPSGISAGGPAGPSLPGGGWVAAAAGAAKAAIAPTAVAAASSRHREADTVISNPVPAATSAAGRHARN